MGNLQHTNALAASAILTLLLMPMATGTLNVSLSTDKTQYTSGESVTISGKVLDGFSNPVAGAAVSIQVNTPKNSPIHVNLVYSEASGSYSDLFTLASNPPLGQYAIYASASKTGFNAGQIQSQFSVSQLTTATTSTSSSSQTTQTSQIGRLCLIATATYGSELTPEVTMLRNFRDSKIENTAVGRNFLISFNAFYYSFSPAVARIISNHQAVRYAMKILLYPLVVTLAASSSLYDAFSVNAELGVTVSGIFAALGIGMVYLGPLLVGIRRIFRVNNFRWIGVGYCILSTAAASTILLGLAELSQNPTFLLLTASATVLSFIALGGMAGASLGWKAARKIARVRLSDV